MSVTLMPFSLDRMELAVERVRERLLRATGILENASVPYAVVGGNAVAAWVTRVDVAAVRYTQDVDILLRREDMPAAVSAMEAEGFIFRHVAGMDVFLDGPNAKARDAVHVVFAGEKVRPDEAMSNPSVWASEQGDNYRVISLEALVQIKLTAYRDKDRTHLRDMLDIGLIDASWKDCYPPELADRLQFLVDTPDG